jgi:UDP-4-amino-4,6-dideoxy-N-acetyl-beta-L-altrosamine N-acetyltransferase
MPAREEYALRLMEEADLAVVLGWRNQPHIREAMYTSHIISAAEHEAWWRKASSDPTKRLLVLEHDDHPIGHVNFVQIHETNGTAYWGFYLGESDAPRGSGAVMEYLALEHAFKRIGLRKLLCEVFSFNDSVTRMHQKFGFTQEGVFRRHFLKNDEYHDVVSLALFADDWEATCENMYARVFRG